MPDEQVSYLLGGEELRRVISLPAEDRVQYFVSQCAHTGQVWTLGADEELLVLAGEDDEAFVVAFPHPDFGEDWFSSTELEDCDLVAVTVSDWADQLLPGLEEALIDVRVMPTSEDEGTLMSPSSLAERMKA